MLNTVMPIDFKFGTWWIYINIKMILTRGRSVGQDEVQSHFQICCQGGGGALVSGTKINDSPVARGDHFFSRVPKIFLLARPCGDWKFSGMCQVQSQEGSEIIQNLWTWKRNEMRSFELNIA